MDIAIQIGANATEGERLMKSLRKNLDRLLAGGVVVPGQGRYRQPLRDALVAELLGRGEADARGPLLDAMLDGQEARRLVISSPSFLALPARIFEAGEFHGTAADRVQALRRLFPEDRIELHLAIRNPATFVPAVWDLAKVRGFSAWMGGVDPRAIAWSPVIEALREAAPDMPLTVWCNEDAALLWGELLARLAGLPHAAPPGAPPVAPLDGRWDLLAAIMSAEGMDRFESYMALHPVRTAEQERRVIGAFLDKFALPEETWDEVDLPGWDHALVDLMTRAYEADVARIARMEGVALVQP